MVNPSLGFLPKWTCTSEIFDRDRKIAAVLAVSIAGHDQPPAKAKAQVTGGIEPRKRRQVGRHLVEGDMPPADRVEIEPVREIDAKRTPGRAMNQDGADCGARPDGGDHAFRGVRA